MEISARPEAGLEPELEARLRELVELALAVGETRTWRLCGRIVGALGPHASAPTAGALRTFEQETLRAREALGPGPASPRAADRAVERMGAAFRSVIGSLPYRLARAAAFAYNAPRGRSASPEPMERLAESLVAWAAFVHRVFVDGARRQPVDVVIPVFGGRDATLRCLESVVGSRNATPHEVFVVDDGNRDSGLLGELVELESAGRLELLRNGRNLGYTASVNRGLALHRDRDVVLLNSDTEVGEGWLDRLRAAAYSDWRIGSVTPFSNNAEICSYPELCRVNRLPEGLDVAELDRLFRSENAGRRYTLPTSVGFATYLRRDCIEEVGSFDVDHFPRGYGEENDFSMRARKAGWRHVIAADTFVYHEGGVSFGRSKERRVRTAVERVAMLHPEYPGDVRRFVEDDPLLEARRRVDLARAPRGGDSVLLVTHGGGGGTERHVGELARALEEAKIRAVVMRPRPGAVSLALPAAPELPNLLFRTPEEYPELLEALAHLRVRHLHYHHLLGLAPEITGLAQDLGCSYDATLHDYFAICPRVHMVDESGLYCGEPEAESCTRCVSRNGSELGWRVDVERHRLRSLAFLEKARHIIVPSADVERRMKRYLPSAAFRVRPHFRTPTRPCVARRSADRPLRVAVIGALGVPKGSQVLEACLDDADARGLLLEFCLVGYSDRDATLLRSPRIEITGRYEEDEAFELLRSRRCHCALLPSVWPETFSYTLSLALAAGLHPVAFDLGAMKERIEGAGFGTLLALGSSASEINDTLLSLELPPFAPAILSKQGGEYPDLWKDYYENPCELERAAPL